MVIIREDSLYHNSTFHSQGYRQARQLVKLSSVQGVTSTCYVLRGGLNGCPLCRRFFWSFDIARFSRDAQWSRGRIRGILRLERWNIIYIYIYIRSDSKHVYVRFIFRL